MQTEPQPQTSEASPLSDVELTALFSADPLTISDTQFESIILYFRDERHKFKKEEVLKAKAPKRGEPKMTIDLDALGL